MFAKLIEFLAGWFQSFKDGTYKVTVDNPVDNSKELSEIKGAVDSIVIPEPKGEVSVSNWPKFPEFKLPKIFSVNVENFPKQKETKEVSINNWPKIDWPKFPEFKLPDVFRIRGKVEVENMPEIPDTVGLKGFDRIIDGLQIVVDSIQELKSEMGGVGKTITATSIGSRRKQELYDSDDNPIFQDESNPGFMKLTDGNYIAGVDVDGHLQTSDNHSGLAIAKGEVTGTTFIHKFGAAADFDAGDGVVTVWDGANDALLTGAAMDYTYSTTADIGTMSSSAADTVDIEVQGLDANYDLQTYTVTLNGTTDVDVSASGGMDLIRVFRMKNVGSTNLAGQVYLRVNGTGQGSGIPSTPSSVRSIIDNGNNQTLMAIYTIPDGHTGYMRSFFAGSAGASKTTDYIVDLFARPFGQVFQLKHRSALVESGTSHWNHQYVEPEVFAAKTDVEIRVQTTESPITAATIAAGFDLVLVES